MRTRSQFAWWSLLSCLLSLLFLANVARAAVIQEEFNTAVLPANWSVWDGYALQAPGDVANHASFSMTGSQLSISFPGGVEHNQWWLKHAQLMRAYPGSGIYEIKVDSSMTGDQQFGLVFQSAPDTFLMFMFYATDQVRAYVERFTNVGGNLLKNTVHGSELGLSVPSAGPYYLRVIVADNADPTQRNWEFLWSADGVNWSQIVSAKFETDDENAGVLQAIGLFAGNQPDSFDAFDALFDYFRYYSSAAELPQPPPANVVARAGDNRVELWWDPVEHADTYAVYSLNGSGGARTLLGFTSSPSFVDLTALNGTTRYYQVAALNAGIEGPLSEEVSAVPHALTAFSSLPEAGLVLALSASELAYVVPNGQPVKQWPNVKGPQLSARSVGSTAPILVHAGLNGKPVVRFDGLDDYLALPSGFQDFTSGMSLYVVMRPTGNNAGFKVLSLGNGAGQQNIVFGRAAATAGYQYFTDSPGGTVSWFNSANGLVTGESSMLSVTQAAGAVGGQSVATIARNGTTLASQSVWVPPIAQRGVNYIGRGYWSDPTFSGDIAEIILYNRVLSGAEELAVYDHIAARYALEVTPPAPTPPPAAPSGVTATAGDGIVSLSWNAVSDASSYRVYRKIGAGSYGQIAEISGTSYADTTVTNNVTYRYVVTAVANSQESSQSAEVIATPEASAAPSVPTGLSAVAGNALVQLSWNSVPNVSGYRVYRGTTSGGPYTLVASTSSTGYLNSGLSNGTTYYFVVRSYTGSRESADSAQVSATPHANPSPDPALPSVGLVLALDAQTAALQFSNGAAVTFWQDTSSNSASAVASGSAAPTLVSNAIGGKPALRFDGVDDHLTLPAGFSDFTAGISLYVVMRPSVMQPGFKLLALGDGPNQHNVVLGRAGSTSGLQYFTNNSAGSVQWFNTSSGLVAGETALISVVQDGGVANASSFAVVSKNGDPLFGQNVFVPPVANRSLNYIGKSYWAADGLFQGDIAEIILYNRKLTNAEQAEVQVYIEAKYGIGPEPLVAPTGVSAIAGNASVALSWNSVSGAAGYRVYRSETSGGPYTLVGTTTANSYGDSGLVNGTTYYYTLKSYAGVQESVASSEISATPQGAPPPNPALPSVGLVLSLDAETAALQYANAAPVTYWQDVSSQGASAIGSGSAAPTLVTNAIGGKPALRFDGVDDHLTLPSGFHDFTAGMSLYVVMRPSVLQTGFKILALGGGASQENIVLGRAGAGPGFQYFTNDSSGNVLWFNTSSGLVAGEATVVSVLQEAGSANNLSFAEVAKNGEPLFGQNVYVPPITARTVNYIGRSYWSEGLFQGDIAEIILYNRKLTAEEQADVKNYIAQKYGIALQ